MQYIILIITTDIIHCPYVSTPGNVFAVGVVADHGRGFAVVAQQCIY